MRAATLYLKSRKRVKASIREVGYPTKNALKDWYQAYKRR